MEKQSMSADICAFPPTPLDSLLSIVAAAGRSAGNTNNTNYLVELDANLHE